MEVGIFCRGFKVCLDGVILTRIMTKNICLRTGVRLSLLGCILRVLVNKLVKNDVFADIVVAGADTWELAVVLRL